MRNKIFTSICGLLFCYVAASQNFSNKGTEFWTGYGLHEKISSGVSDMTLYFTSDDTATVNIYVGNQLFQTLSLAAGTITASNNIPESGAMDARLQNEQVYVNKGIHIISTSPIVAYAQIWGSQVTATTILFPVPTLGRSYTGLNYTQISNASGMRSYVFVVATEDGTSVEVQPPTGTNTVGIIGGTVATQTLNKGDVWLLKGAFDNTDLTGIRIRSVSGANGTCKPIAVFSGSQKISITCTPSSASGDNLFQQAFPMAAWGKHYVTAPTAGVSYDKNIYRVMINPDSPATVVKVNNVTLPGSVPGISQPLSTFTPGSPISFANNLYYEFMANGPVQIDASSPVMVAQYISNRDKCDNHYAISAGDPDMIYLSPIEQTIDKIIVSPVPTENNNATNYLNVVMKTIDVPNFTIRNQTNAIVPATFVPVPINPAYSYAQVTLANGYSPAVYYKLQTTSGGFNAIAYGYASSESYAYNAGTNVKNLNQQLTSLNPLGVGTSSKICKGTPTSLSVTLPYIPTTMTLQFQGDPNVTPNADVTVASPTPVSTTVNVNGVQVYTFTFPGLYNFTTTGTHNVQVLANNPTPDGCNGLEVIRFTVTVFGSPTSKFTWSLTGCGTDPVQFFDQSTDTVSTINRWNWNFGDGPPAGTSTVQNPVYSYSGGGTYPVILRAINVEGCYKDTTINLILSGTPVADFTVSGTACTGNTITFTDQSTVSPGTLVKWYWDYGDGSKDTVFSATPPRTHVYTGGGTYTVKLKVENSNGCTSTKTINVFIGTTPYAAFQLPGNICLPGGGAQFINQSSVVGGFPISYTWNFGDGSPTSNLVNPIHIYGGTGPYTVTLTATVGACSKDSVQLFTTLYQKPSAAFSVNPENCLNDPTVFTNQSTSVNSTINNWVWLFGDGNTSTSQNPSHTYSSPGTYTVKLVVKTDKGCESDTAYHTVTINALPTADFTISSPACEGQSVTITSTAVANSGTLNTWYWDFGDGSKDTLFNANPFQHIYTNAGNYTITLKVKNSKGCFSGSFSRSITVNATPKPGFNYSLPLCLPGAISFTNTTTISDGTIASTGYVWDFGDATPTVTLANPSHNYATGGVYTVKLTATSNQGCSKDSIRTLTVYNSPTAKYAVNNTGNVCSNQALSITNQSAVTGFGTVNKIEVYWDYQNNLSDITIDNAPVANSIYTHNYPVFGSPLTKTYRVLIRAYSGNGCSNDYFQDIIVHAAPQATMGSIPPVCEDALPFILTQGNELTGMAGLGVYSGNGITLSPLFTPQLAGSGSHTIRYTYTGVNGCSSYAEQNIQVYPTPTVNAGPDLKVLEGDAVTLQLFASGNNLYYQWLPSTYLDDASKANPVCRPLNDITYRIQVVSADGCKASDDLFIKVIKDFVVPNTFTPNNDGINDLWTIDYLYLYPNHRVQVFNRYGQLVFESKNYNSPWNGTYKGKPLPVGTYYYIIELGGQRKPKTGYVTIIK